MRKHVEIECEKKSVLLLEGSDDCHIIDKFCKDNDDIKTNFGFYNCGGDSKVLSKLNALLKSEVPLEVIGIILDADKDVDARYQQIKKKVENFYKLPLSMPNNGLVHTEKKPRLGIWIMPNNQDNGALEEFYLELATDIDKNFIDDIIKQADSKGLTSFKTQHRNKAIMRTYFAWQDKPGMPLYSAINKIALNNNEYVAKAFKVWLIKLFS